VRFNANEPKLKPALSIPQKKPGTAVRGEKAGSRNIVGGVADQRKQDGGGVTKTKLGKLGHGSEPQTGGKRVQIKGEKKKCGAGKKRKKNRNRTNLLSKNTKKGELTAKTNKV